MTADLRRGLLSGGHRPPLQDLRNLQERLTSLAPETMPRGVTVAREILDLFVKVRILARQPISKQTPSARYRPGMVIASIGIRSIRRSRRPRSCTADRLSSCVRDAVISVHDPSFVLTE